MNNLHLWLKLPETRTMISILMPVHNTAPYLVSCLDSICQQSLKTWELIAIDDFSTDESSQILEEYAQLDHRISWYRNDEKGIIPALQKAYHLSQGEMIHRMDSDDIMPSDKLENLHRTLVAAGRGSVATGMVRYFSTQLELQRGFLDYGQWINDHIANKTIFQDIFMECPIASPAWLIHREDLDRIGGVTGVQYPEDYDLVFRMYVHGLSAEGIPRVVHLWRDWSDRASRTKKEYADQLFFELKIRYFTEYKYRKNQPIVIWGAGRKGKNLFRLFHKTGLPITWITENPNKIGQQIYGTTLSTPKESITSGSQVIVAISDPKAKVDIRQRLQAMGKVNNSDMFFFC